MYLRFLRRNTDYAIIIFGISIFTELGRECRGEITFPPSNTVVLDGEEVLMECQTNHSGKILWRKFENSSTESKPVIIFTGSRITKNFSHIYDFNKTTGGEYDLSMNASMAVAGKYVCDEPGGKIVSAELIVLASNPICFIKKPVGFNSTLECRLRLNGNWFPEMEWEEEYYNETLNDSHVTRMTANTVASNDLIVSTMTIAGEEFQRNVTCKTKFTSTGLPNSTTAKNIPNYEYKCIISVSSLQQSSTTGFSKLVNSTEVMALSSTAFYTDDYQIPLMIVSFIICAVLALLICILCKRNHRAQVLKRTKNRNENATNEGVLFVRQSREMERHGRNMEPIHNDGPQTQPNVTLGVQRPTECADVIKDAAVNSRCTSDDGVVYMEVNGYREQPVELSPTHPSNYEHVIYAAIDHTNPPPRPPKAIR